MEKNRHELRDKLEHLFGVYCGIDNGKKNNYIINIIYIKIYILLFIIFNFNL